MGEPDPVLVLATSGAHGGVRAILPGTGLLAALAAGGGARAVTGAVTVHTRARAGSIATTRSGWVMPSVRGQAWLIVGHATNMAVQIEANIKGVNKGRVEGDRRRHRRNREAAA
jgi:hypothetical protein